MPPAASGEKRCSARARTGGRCGQYAIKGATVCYLHGGLSAQVRRRVARDLAVTMFGSPLEMDAAAVLLNELHRSIGHVLWLAARVAELPGSLGVDERGGIVDDPIVAQYRRERAHLVRVAGIAVAAGIMEKRAESVERQTDILLEALRLTVAQTGLDAVPDIDSIFQANVLELESGGGDVG